MDINRVEQLAHGNIPRLLLRFSVPAMIGIYAQALYNVIDRVFVGNAIGENGMAAITVSFPFMLIVVGLCMLAGVGAAALISIRLGEGRKDEAERILGNSIILMLAVSAAVTLLGWLWLDDILELFGASQTVMPYAQDYLGIIVLGSVFQIVGFGLNAAIRGEGNPRIAMLSMLVSVGVNIALAPLFIYVFSWGMKGAALATVLAQVSLAAWVLKYFLSGKSMLKIRIRNLIPDRRLCLKIASVGSPHCAMQVVGSMMQMLMNNQLSVHGGDQAIAVMGAVYPLLMLMGMPIFGINQGAQPIIGYNYGARLYDRVRKTLMTAVLGASTLMVGGFVLAMLFPTQLLRIFGGDERMVEVGSNAMRICCLMAPIIGFQIVGASYFQAIGRPAKAMTLMLSRQLLILVPAMLILPRFFGLYGVFAAFPTADFGASTVTGICVLLELRNLGGKC
jgi:putative MATE family efflux protein